MQDELAGKRILIVEDEFYIAADLQRALEECRAEVVGPVSRLSRALTFSNSEPLDAALLDINLEREASFPLAKALGDRRVPFMFVTGYDDCSIPPEYRDVPRITKPFEMEKLIETVGQLVARNEPA